MLYTQSQLKLLVLSQRKPSQHIQLQTAKIVKIVNWSNIELWELHLITEENSHAAHVSKSKGELEGVFNTFALSTNGSIFILKDLAASFDR